MESTKFPQLKKPGMVEDSGMNLRYPDIFLQSFTSIIVGKSNSGKSHLLGQLLTDKNLYGGAFDLILIFSPSIISSQLVQNKENWCLSLDFQWLYDKLMRFQKANEKSQKKLNICIVFDDFVSQLAQQQYNPLLTQLFLNRRKLIPQPKTTISIFVVTQKYNSVPLKFRNNADSLYLFAVNDEEWKTIRKELQTQDTRLVQQIIQKIFTKPYKFAYIKNNPFQIYEEFNRINFFTSGDMFQSLMEQSIESAPKKSFFKQKIKNEQLSEEDYDEDLPTEVEDNKFNKQQFNVQPQNQQIKPRFYPGVIP